MIDWRESLREILDDTRLLGLSSVVITSELLVRAVLSAEFSSLWIVAWPPIITVVVFGLALTTNRFETTETRQLESKRDLARQAVLFGLIAIFGHAVAVIAGAAVFFAVDTPLRLFVYWLGLDLANWTFAYLGLPLIGLALGTAIVWVLPATIAADVSRGSSLRTALRRLIMGLSRNRPFFDRLAAVNMSVVFSVVVSIVLSLRVLRAAGINEYLRGGDFHVGSHATMLVLILALAAVLALVPLALAVHLSFTSPSRIDSIEPQPLSSNGPFSRLRPMLTIVLVIILVVSLIAVAGTVRTEDIRPTDGRNAEPLPDSTGVMVLQAHQNLIAYNYEISEYDLKENPDELEHKGSINLQRREANEFHTIPSHCRWAWESWSQESPTEAVLQANPMWRVPNNLPGDSWDEMKEYQTFLYHFLPKVGQNATVEFSEEYSEDTITVETTASEAILSKTGHSDILSQDRLVVDESWMKIEIDRKTKTTRGVEYRFEVQYQGENGERERESRHVRYDVEIGSDIDPCDGQRPLEERVWRMLLY